MQGAKITGSQDRQFGSENKERRLGPKCLDPWREKRVGIERRNEG